jgi:peptidylamidoglycolate lyase
MSEMHTSLRFPSDAIHRTASRILRIACVILLFATMSVSTAQPLPSYTVVPGWPVLPVGGELGQATGVGVDSMNRVWVFHRAGRTWSEPFPRDPIPRTTIAAFDAETGRTIKILGQNRFIMPHGLTIDQKDNVWVTDVGLHQIFKFDPEGRLLLVLGEAGRSGDDARHFNRPTDVAVLPGGSFYVSDGYGNARVMKFSSDGHFEFAWGRKGTGKGAFDTPHAIALDAAGRVYVADRGNKRVQLFDAKGGYVTEWADEKLGRPYSLAVSPTLGIIVDGGDQTGCAQIERSRAIEVGPDGQVIAQFGSYGDQAGQFRMAHDVALGPDGAVYVVDVDGRRVQKFVRR